MQRYFVTGGTGFFGRALLRYWIARQRSGDAVPRVTVLTRSAAAFLQQFPEFDGHAWLDFHVGDICDQSTLPAGHAYSHVLHAATDSTFGPRLTPLQRYDQIVTGTRNLLDFAVACGAERFLLTSSGAVYGPQPPHLDRIPEDWLGMPDSLNPANAYGVAKRSVEHLCALYREQHGLHTVIARCFAFVGPDLPLDAHFAIGNFIRDALWRDQITVNGDGTPQRSYLDQRDLAEWLLTMLEQGHAGRAYNIGSDQAIMIAALAELVRDIVAPGKRVSILGKSGDNPGRNLYIPSIQRARDELGLEIRIPLAESIRMTAESAYASHRDYS